MDSIFQVYYFKVCVFQVCRLSEIPWQSISINFKYSLFQYSQFQECILAEIPPMEYSTLFKVYCFQVLQIPWIANSMVQPIHGVYFPGVLFLGVTIQHPPQDLRVMYL